MALWRGDVDSAMPTPYDCKDFFAKVSLRSVSPEGSQIAKHAGVFRDLATASGGAGGWDGSAGEGGVAPADRVVEPLGIERPAAAGQGVVDRNAGRGLLPDLLGDVDDVAPLVLNEVAIDDRAVSRHDNTRRGQQPDDDVEREGPVEREAVAPVRRRRARLDQVAGVHDIDLRHPYDDVAVGVAAAGVRELDEAIAQVSGPHRRERLGRHDHLGVADLQAARVVWVRGVARLVPR